MSFKYTDRSLMEKRDTVGGTTREHQASDDTWAVVSSETLAQTHTQNSKTAGQTLQVSALLLTWKIRWRLWLDERTGTKRIEGTRLCFPLHIMCWRGWGPPPSSGSIAFSHSWCVCVCRRSALQLTSLHVNVRTGLAHTHFLVWVMVSEIVMLQLRLTDRHCYIHSSS